MKKKFKDTKVGQFLIGKNGLFKNLGNIVPDKGLLGVIKNLRWEADLTSDSFLSKNVRPMTLIFFSVAYVVGWFLEYSLDSITGVLTVIIGAYFGSRGLEKYKKISR